MWTPLYMDSPEDEEHPAPVETTSQILAEYLWLSGNGTQLRSQTRVVTPSMGFVEGHLPAEACPMTVVQDGVEIFLKPRKVFRDPFRGGAHILVMCDTFRMQVSEIGEDQRVSFQAPATLVATSNNHRVHCAAVMEAAKAEQPLFSVEQEYQLHQTAAAKMPAQNHGSSDFQGQACDSPQHSNSTKGGNLFTPYGDSLHGLTGQLQHWGEDTQHVNHLPGKPGPASGPPSSTLSHQCASIFLSEAHQQHCLFAGIPVASRHRSGKPSTWSYTIGPCGGVDLGDHLWASRYTLLRLAEQLEQRVAFETLTDPAYMPVDWGHTSLKPFQHTYFEPGQQLSQTQQAPSCALHFSTLLSRHPSVGPLVLQRYMQKLRETHGHSGHAYGASPQASQTLACPSSYCNGAEVDSNQWGSLLSMPRLPCSSQLNVSCDSAVSVVPRSGQLIDHRPTATMDPYLATMFLVSSTLDLAVPVCAQQPTPYELACCDTASSKQQQTVCSHHAPAALINHVCLSPHLSEICRLADAEWVAAALTRCAEVCPSVYPQDVGFAGIFADSPGQSTATTGSRFRHHSPQLAMDCNYAATNYPYQQQQYLASIKPDSAGTVQLDVAAQFKTNSPYSLDSMQFGAAALDYDSLDALDIDRMDTYSSGDITEDDDVSDGGVTYQAGSGGEEEEYGSEEEAEVGEDEETGESLDCNRIPSEDLLLDALDEMDGLSFTAESSGGFLDSVKSDWAVTRGPFTGFGAMTSRRGSCTGGLGV